MTSQGPAPLTKPVFSIKGLLEKAWLQWFSDIGDSIGGEWSLQRRQLTSQNIDKAPDTSFVSYQGREIRFLLVWNTGFTASADAKLLLSKGDYTMLPGILEVWEDGSLTIGAFGSEKEINIPAATYTGRVIIQGTLLTKVQDPRGV